MTAKTLAALAALTLAAALSPAAGARQSSKGSVPITGRVVFVGGDPPPTCTVYVGPIAVSDDDDTKIAVGDDGAFSTAPLAPGSYPVFALAPGYDMEESDRPVHAPGDVLVLTLRKCAVITGTVTDASGEPVGGALVEPVLVRYAGAPRLRRPSREFFRARYTDDRGVYRLYDLEPGTYLVLARGADRDTSLSYVVPPRIGEGVVFHPSSGRADAEPVAVEWGEERTGVDVRLTGRRSFSVEGVVVDRSAPNDDWISVALYGPDGLELSSDGIDASEADRSFAFPGVPDGDYEVVAERSDRHDDTRARGAKRVTVRGASVTGLSIALAPVAPKATVGGRVALDPGEPGPPDKREPAVTRIVIQGAAPAGSATTFGDELPSEWLAVPGADGSFSRSVVGEWSYRLAVDLPSDDWFVRAVTRGGKGDGSLRVLAVAPGEKATDLVVAVGRGAGGVTGRVLPRTGGEKPPPGLVVYLVPADPALAGNLWRYAEAEPRADGAFAFRGVAPGTYRIVARPAPQPDDGSPVWDAARRAALRADAEKLGREVEVAPRSRAAVDVAAPVR